MRGRTSSALLTFGRPGLIQRVSCVGLPAPHRDGHLHRARAHPRPRPCPPARVPQLVPSLAAASLCLVRDASTAVAADPPTRGAAFHPLWSEVLSDAEHVCCILVSSETPPRRSRHSAADACGLPPPSSGWGPFCCCTCLLQPLSRPRHRRCRGKQPLTRSAVAVLRKHQKPGLEHTTYCGVRRL